MPANDDNVVLNDKQLNDNVIDDFNNRCPNHDDSPTLRGVSCLCPTYGRFHLLAEAVESFLRQDYAGPKELIILNDLPQQQIKFSHHEVRVVNVSERFPNLGAKRNHAAALARYQLLLTWGDDDIHLPHRISRMVESLGERPFLLEGWHYCSYGAQLLLNRFPTMGAHIVDKKFYFSIGGVPEKDTGEDAGFNDRAKKVLGKIDHATENPAFWYRWSGTERPHISAFHDPKGVRDPYELFRLRVQHLLESGAEPTGELTLVPAWRKDYETEKRNAVVK